MPATTSVRTVVLFSLSLKTWSSISVLPQVVALSVRALPCAKPARAGQVCLCRACSLQSAATPRRPERGPIQHADEPVFPADPEGESGRGPDRVAPADVACRSRPADQRRHLRLAAAWLSRPEEHRADRARRAGRRGCPGSVDADHPIGRPVARERALRRLRAGNAAHQGSPRSRHAVRTDQRGDDHRSLSRRGEELSRPAEESLSHPVEVPGRGAAALRRHARARIPDEGQLLLRHRSGRRHPVLQQHVRGLPADLRPDGAEGDPDARRHRPDRRRPQP